MSDQQQNMSVEELLREEGSSFINLDELAELQEFLFDFSGYEKEEYLSQIDWSEVW